jgi:hypothetical protein
MDAQLEGLKFDDNGMIPAIVQDHRTGEVGQALGLSAATVRVHLFRAVRKLRKLLASERVAKKPRLSESDTQVLEAPAATRSAG